MTPQALADTHSAAFTLSRPWRAEEFRDLLDDRFAFIVGDARCFALGRVVAGEAEVLTIATHPDFQRQGLARAVMTNWLTRAVDLGGETAFLEVAEDNAPARALYGVFGFCQAGCRPGYYPRQTGTPVDALVLSRPLPWESNPDSRTKRSKSG